MKGTYQGIPAQCAPKIERMVDLLDSAVEPTCLNIVGYKFHGLKGSRKGTYALWVTGNWRVTFRFDGENAIDVDLEDYH